MVCYKKKVTIKRFNGALFAHDDILFIDEDSRNATLPIDEMVFIEISADLDDISLDEINFDKHDPETIIHVRLMAWCSRYKQCKACKRKI